jgi:hypothetical protein
METPEGFPVTWRVAPSHAPRSLDTLVYPESRILGEGADLLGGDEKIPDVLDIYPPHPPNTVTSSSAATLWCLFPYPKLPLVIFATQLQTYKQYLHRGQKQYI